MSYLPTDAAALALQRWSVELSAARDDSAALALGIFDLAGNPLYLNRGMGEALGGELPDRSRHLYLVNPSFDELLEPADDGLVFCGWLTAGDGFQISRTLRAQVFRKGGELLIAGEYDALELERLGRDLSRRNQEINNLQRELIRKNARLSQTLDGLKEAPPPASGANGRGLGSPRRLAAEVAPEIGGSLAVIADKLAVLRREMENLGAVGRQLDTPVAAATRPGEATPLARSDFDRTLDDCLRLLAGVEENVGQARRMAAGW
ncbi:MAG: hypothetical protein V9H25_11965 [Candidatus Competibacter sp.]